MNWSKVELHCHTLASDGDLSCEQIVDRAIERDYKAIAVTDHNTTSNVSSIIEYAKSKHMPIIKGIEWTTFWGHIVVHGGHSKVDWRDITLSNIDECISIAKASGDIVTLAHPYRLGFPFCSCCFNQFDIKQWQNIDAIEVYSHFNPHKDKASQKAIELWHNLLKAGYKIGATYGYDWHELDYNPPIFAYTYVGCEGDVNEDSTIQAIKNHHTIVSLGLDTDIKFVKNNQVYCVGDIVGGGKLVIDMKVSCEPQYAEHHKVTPRYVKVITGHTCSRYELTGKTFCQEIDMSDDFVRLEIWGDIDCDEDSLLVITSPIWNK